MPALQPTKQQLDDLVTAIHTSTKRLDAQRNRQIVRVMWQLLRDFFLEEAAKKCSNPQDSAAIRGLKALP